MSFLGWLIVTLIGVANILLNFYIFTIFVYFITRLLVNFGSISAHNPVVQFILQIGSAIIEPVLKPIRRFVPPINGMDFSLLVLGICLYVLQSFLGYVAYNAATL